MSPASPATIDEYIALYPPEIQGILTAIRETIRRAAPEAGEKIGYGIPTFTLQANLVQFAAFEQPAMRIQAIGCGFGTKQLPWPNMIRVWIGEAAGMAPDHVPVYRPQNLELLEQARLQVMQAESVLAQARQDLALRVATA